MYHDVIFGLHASRDLFLCNRPRGRSSRLDANRLMLVDVVLTSLLSLAYYNKQY